MTPRDYVKNEFNIKDAIYDKRLSNVEFRILMFVEYCDRWKIDWRKMTWKEIGNKWLGGMYRQTMSKSFRKLQETNYLGLCGK